MNLHLKRYFRQPLKSIPITLLLAAIGGIILASCSPSCNVNAYNDMVQLQMQRWEEAMTLAKQLPPERLPGQVATLQAIKNSMGDLKVPDCTFKAHAQLLTAMNYGIAGFADIAAQAPQKTVDYDFNNYQNGIDQYHQMLDQLSK